MKPDIRSCADANIMAAARIIKEGGLIIYPTDTLYGLGCNALDEKAVQRVFTIKNRNPTKPLSIAICDLKMLRKFTYFDDRALRVMERFFPGPVTFLLKKKGLPEVLTGGSEKVGIRIPECRAALKLIMEAGVPIVSTSANLSGMTPPLTVEDAAEHLPDVGLALDMGRLEGLPSTIIDLALEEPKIIREGKKPSNDIVPVLQEIYDL